MPQLEGFYLSRELLNSRRSISRSGLKARASDSVCVLADAIIATARFATLIAGSALKAPCTYDAFNAVPALTMCEVVYQACHYYTYGA